MSALSNVNFQVLLYKRAGKTVEEEFYNGTFHFFFTIKPKVVDKCHSQLNYKGYSS